MNDLQKAARAMLDMVRLVDADEELDSRIDGTLIDNLAIALEAPPGTLRAAAREALAILEVGTNQGLHHMNTLEGRCAWIKRMRPVRERLRAALGRPAQTQSTPNSLTRTVMAETEAGVNVVDHVSIDALIADIDSPTSPDKLREWTCTNCGMEIRDADVIAHADLPTTVGLWHKNSDGLWCGPVAKTGDNARHPKGR